MRSEHRAPFVASIVVVLACIGVMAHAVRTDALGGIAARLPMGLIAAPVLHPKPEPVAPPADSSVSAADLPIPGSSHAGGDASGDDAAPPASGKHAVRGASVGRDLHPEGRNGSHLSEHASGSGLSSAPVVDPVLPAAPTDTTDTPVAPTAPATPVAPVAPEVPSPGRGGDYGHHDWGRGPSNGAGPGTGGKTSSAIRDTLSGLIASGVKNPVRGTTSTITTPPSPAGTSPSAAPTTSPTTSPTPGGWGGRDEDSRSGSHGHGHGHGWGHGDRGGYGDSNDSNDQGHRSWR